jgi:hypothetical protein
MGQLRPLTLADVRYIFAKYKISAHIYKEEEEDGPVIVVPNDDQDQYLPAVLKKPGYVVFLYGDGDVVFPESFFTN